MGLQIMKIQVAIADDEASSEDVVIKRKNECGDRFNLFQVPNHPYTKSCFGYPNWILVWKKPQIKM